MTSVFRSYPEKKSAVPYRGTSLIKKRTPLGPYRRPMPRVPGGSEGGWRFLLGKVPLYLEGQARVGQRHGPLPRGAMFVTSEVPLY